MLNPGLRKTELKDKDGNTLLVRTTASMVSEEPDRQFIDNVEKTLLNNLTSESEALKEIASYVAEVRVLADNIDSLIAVAGNTNNLSELATNAERLNLLVPLLPRLEAMSKGVLEITGPTGKLYSIDVDETGAEPVLKLTETVPPVEPTEETVVGPPGGEESLQDVTAEPVVPVKGNPEEDTPPHHE